MKSENLTMEIKMLDEQIRNSSSQEPVQAYSLRLKDVNETLAQGNSSSEAEAEMTTTTTVETTTTPIDWDLFCEQLPAETGFLPDPYSCNKYIRCNHGKSQRFTCASGTVWDIENSMCLWSESVDCMERELEEEEEKGEKESEKEGEYEYEYYTDEELAELEAKEKLAKMTTDSTTCTLLLLLSAEGSRSEAQVFLPAYSQHQLLIGSLFDNNHFFLLNLKLILTRFFLFSINSTNKLTVTSSPEPVEKGTKLELTLIHIFFLFY